MSLPAPQRKRQTKSRNSSDIAETSSVDGSVVSSLNTNESVEDGYEQYDFDQLFGKYHNIVYFLNL
jgi:hypothetical protein